GRGLAADIASLWTLAPVLSFNLTVTNNTKQDVTFDAARTSLVGATKADVTKSQSHTAGLNRIPAGGSAAGTINFGAPPQTTKGLVVTFDPAKGPPVELSVSLNRLA